MKRIVSLLLGFFFFYYAYSQQYIVKFSIDVLAKLPDYVSIDNVKGDQVVGYIWGKDNYLDFKKKFPNSIDLPKPGFGKSIVMANSIEDMANWDRYPTYEVYVQMMNRFAEDYPSLVRLDTIGYSQQGRLLLAVKITDNPDKEEFEPQFFYTSSMHGDELTGYVLMLRLIDYLLNNYNKDSLITYLINNYEIYINPLANPDGAYHGGNSDVSNSQRYYYNGTDPNRDFYPGPADGDTTGEIETEAMKQYASNHHFIMSVNFHGGAEVYNYPWDVYTSDQNTHADDAWFRAVGKRYVDTARKVDPNYMTDVNNSGITEGGDWYVVHGSRQDYMTYIQHCREATIELSSTKLVNSDQLPYFWNLNYKSLIYYILEAEKGVQGIVLNSDGSGKNAKIYLYGYDQVNDNSLIYSFGENGRYFRPLLPDNYRLLIKEGTTTLVDQSVDVTQGRNIVNYIPNPQLHNITFKVIDDSAFNPIANVSVIVNGDTLITSENGIVQTNLSTGVYRVNVICDSLGYNQLFYESIIKNDTLLYILPASYIEDDSSGIITSTNLLENIIRIYPQPADRYFYIQGDETINSIEIYSVDGILLMKRKLQTNQIPVNIYGLKPGIYFLKLKSQKGYIFKRLLVN